MKKITNVLLATILTISSLVGTVHTIAATSAEESHITAAELCKSANTWEEYKATFKEFQCEQGDFLGKILKDLSEKIEDLSTFMGTLSYSGINDSEVDEFVDVIRHATDLYSNSETGHLRFSVEKMDLNAPYSQVNVFVKDIPLTNVGNVVLCYDIPYYSNIDTYMAGQDANFYDGQLMCYTCGVSYWNPDGTLAKMEYIPYDKVAQLKDEQKPQIDINFEGTILVLLCTTDSLLGWTGLDGLYQYEDATGNMEFFISYR